MSPTAQSPSAQSLEAEHLGRPPQARNDPPPCTAPVGRKGQQPAEAVTELSPKSRAGEATQVKERTTFALSSHCLPSSKIRAVEYQQDVRIKGLYIFTGGTPAEMYSSHHMKNSLQQHPGHLQRKHHSLKFENAKPHALFIIRSFIKRKKKNQKQTPRI